MSNAKGFDHPTSNGKKHILNAKIAKNIMHVQRNRLHIGLLCRYANSSMSTQQTKLRTTEDKMINKQFFFQPTVLLKSTTTSLLGAKNILFFCFRRDNETFTCRFASVQSDYKQREEREAFSDSAGWQRYFPSQNNRNYNISVQMISQTNLKTKTPFTVSLFWLLK